MILPVIGGPAANISHSYDSRLSVTAHDDRKETFSMAFEKGLVLCRRISDNVALVAPSLQPAGSTQQESFRHEFGVIEASADFFEQGNSFSGILGLAYPSIAFVWLSAGCDVYSQQW
jgi:hypothetical protein